MLIFYLFDIQRRHDNIRGMSTRRKADPSKFNEFSKEVMSSVFQEKLKNAVAYPGGRDAKYILNKLLPVLASAGKHTAFGALEWNSSLGEIYAMICRFGPEFELLTIAFDDVNSPQVFRLTFSQPYNINFPSVASKHFLSSMKYGIPFTSGEEKNNKLECSCYCCNK
jgi:hypothetical protein